MIVDVWSDIACPWCTVGRQHLLKALEEFEGDVELRWRSFELNPSAPAAVHGDYAQQLADKYGMPVEKARGWMDEMQERAAPFDLEFDWKTLKAGNTFKAHQVLHLATQHGLQDALKSRLFNAYFSEGALMSDDDTLVTLCVEVGLDEAEVRDALAKETFASEVRGDQQLAQQLGVSGVPFFVFDRRVAVNGAQPPEVLLQALRQTLETAEPKAESAPVCGPDGCAI